LIICLGIFGMGCTGDKKPVYSELAAVIDSIRQKYAPDSRDDVFDIKISNSNGRAVIKGVTSVLEAKKELRRLVDERFDYAIDSVRVLPDESVGERCYGIVNVSVADARMKADFGAEMATQWLLGAPVELLQHEGWWRVKSVAEGYVAWITGSSFVRVNRDEYEDWLKSPKIVFTDIYGFAFETPDENGQHAQDLVAGNILRYKGVEGRFYKAECPDGRVIYVPCNQSKHLDEWLSSTKLSEQDIVATAMILNGIPYQWGGTSTKGMDCSGFTKTVFLMNGVILRRDASQQAKTGIPVDISDGYSNLRTGDLMFFGAKEHIRHVAIYLGNSEFIHSAGYVRINSLDSTKVNYDADNTREFVRATRVIGSVDTLGVKSLRNFYHSFQ